MKNKYWAFVVLVLGLVISSPAFAVCSNNEDGEPGVAGEIEYFTAASMLRYCDGTNWIDMVVPAVSTGGGDVTTGLVSNWQFEETSGGTAVDSIGGFDGSFITGRTAADATTTGQISNGFNFANTNDHRIETTNNTFDTADDVTFSTWFNNTVVGSGDRIVLSQGDDAGNGGGAQFEFTLAVGDVTGGSDSSVQFHVEVDGTSGVDAADILITHPFTDTGIWQHAVVTVENATSSTPTAIMYLNGSQVGTDTATSAIPRGTWDKDFVIGAAPNGTRPFNGDIDEVRVYDRVLSSTEVEALYNFQAGIVAPSGGGCAAIGDQCSDGSIYAGLTPDTGEPFYITDTNQGTSVQWNTVTGNDDINGEYDDNGAFNHASVNVAFSNLPAMNACETLSLHGNDDWYLPAPNELLVIYANRAAIDANATDAISGSFWSSREVSNNNQAQRLDGTGVIQNNTKTQDYNVRCARRGEIATITAGLVSRWRLDETTGTTFADSIGPNTGTYSEASISSEIGIFDNAADFSATDDDVDAGSNLTLDVLNGTISLWFKTPNADVASNRYLVAKDATGNNAGDLGLLIKNSTDGGNPSEIELITNDGSSNNSIFSDSDISGDQWTHVAVNFGTNGKRMYVNGVLQADTDTDSTGMTNASANFIIGNLRAGNTLDFDGEIDDVRLYDITLTADEIQTLFEEGLDGTSLVAHWKFDEDSGTSVADSTGNGTAGTMENGLDAGNDSVTGVHGNALFIDDNGASAEDTVTANLGTEAQSLDQLSYSVWVKFDSLPDAGSRIFESLGVGQSLNSISIQNNDEIYIALQKASNLNANWNTPGAGVNLQNDIWYHIVVTYDYSSTANDPVLYVNNTTYALTETDSPNTTTNPNTSTQIAIGNRGTDDRSIDGAMDDFRIYNRVLSADEVSALYNRGRDRGLVGYWKLDETSGTTAVDSTANGNNGTVYNANFGTDGVSAVFDNGLSMDGSSNTRVQVADNDVFDVTSYTLSAWVRGDNPSDEAGSSIEKVISKDRNFIMNWDHSSQGGASCEHNNSGWITTGDAPDLLANRWYHLACTYDETSQDYIFYVDGIEVSRATSVAAPSANTDPLLFGRYTLASAQDLDGDLDDIRIYNRALSEREIQSLYEDTGREAGLIGHWEFEETSGTTAADSSGGENDGTMQNGLDAGNDNVSGVFGQALEFDGSDDYVAVPDMDMWDLRNTGSTFATWFNADPSQPDSYPRFIDRFTGSGFDGYRFGLDINGDNIEFGYYGTDNAFMTSTGTYNDGQWHHAAVTLDGTTARMYINGVETDSDTYSGLRNHTQAIRLGGETGSNNVLNGALDDTRIYNRTLSAAEILALYQEGGISTVIDDSPTGWWKLDETSGTTAVDSAGTLDATMNNGLDAGNDNAAGVFNTALDFDGSNDYLVVPAAGTYLDNMDRFTMSSWFYADTLSGDPRIFDFDDTNADADGRLSINSSGRVTFSATRWSTSNPSWQSADGVVTTGQWYHIAVSYDYTSTANDPVVYLNGASISLTETAVPTGVATVADHDLTIGNEKGAAGTREFDGRIDDFRAYNRILSAAEVLALYEDGSSNPSFGLVAHWRFDETSGTSVADSTGNAAAGTMNNGLDATNDSVTGVFGNALYIDDNGASAEDVVIGNLGTGAQNLSQFTKSMWVNVPVVGGTQRLYEYEFPDGFENGFIRFDGTLQFNVEMGASLNDVGWRTDSSVITAGTWHHIVFSHDFSSVSNDGIVYVDGVLASVSEIGGPPVGTGNFNTSPQIRIGNRIGEDTSLDGAMDDFRIYNRVLSEAEILDLYAMGSGSADLVGHWKLDETTGTNAVDSSIYENDGTYTGGVTPASHSVSGVLDTAIDFTNDNNHRIAATAQSPSYTATGDVTISAWAKYDGSTLSEIDGIVSIGDGDGDWLQVLRRNSSRQIQVEADAWSGGTLNAYTTGVEPLQDDTWVHVAVTYSYNDPINTDPVIYINGVAQTGLGGANTSGSYSRPTNTEVKISRRYDATNSAFNGAIDDVRVYSRILSASEIEALYQESGRTANLVAWWKLDETSGNTISDFAGSLNGTWTDDGDNNVSGESATGKIGNSLTFTSTSGATTDDRIDFGDPTLTDGLSGMTVCSWILPTGSFLGTEPVVAKWNSSSGDFMLFVDDVGATSGRTDTLSFITSDGIRVEGSNSLIQRDVWQHVCGVFDSGNRILFHNGIEDQSLSGGSTTIASGTSNLQIGREVSGQEFQGRIDDVRIYDRALSADEIFAVYACSKGPGTQFYNPTADVMQWCNNAYSVTNMYVPASGSGGCTTPTASEGALNYVTDRYQGCDGNGWIDIGK